MPYSPGKKITLQELHDSRDRKITHKVISLIGESVWKVSHVGTREECLINAEKPQRWAHPRIIRRVLPLSGSDFGLIGIAPLTIDFGEGYYL